MNHENARKLLFSVADALDAAKIPFFLTHGTALGFYRDNGFAPHDDDMDLGALQEEFTPKAGKLAMLLTDVHHCEINTLYEPWTRCVGMQIRRDGEHVDLVAHVRWTDQVHGDDFRLDPSVMSDFVGAFPHELLETYEKMNVFGRDWNVPSPIERYLYLNYGRDWRRPKREHAYQDGVGSVRIKGFLKSRGVPRDLLE